MAPWIALVVLVPVLSLASDWAPHWVIELVRVLLRR
jgi:hypothetical protein